MRPPISYGIFCYCWLGGLKRGKNCLELNSMQNNGRLGSG